MNRFFELLAIVAIGCGSAAACSSSTDATPGGGTGGDAGDGGAPTDDSGTGGGTECTAAREQLLVPIGKVSTGEVKIVKTEGDVTTVYVDGSAGGFTEARKNPRIYVKLDGTRVDVSDKDAFTSPDWDLALKRAVVFTNGGDTGAGKGGGARVEKDFAAVTASDAASVQPEKLFDENCEAQRDRINDPLTTFSDWYDYNESTNQITGPRKGVTFVVKSGDGTKTYKVGILSYTGKPDGATDAPSGGFYLLQIAPL